MDIYSNIIDFNLRIYIDDKFSFTYSISSSFTVAQLKAVIRLHSNLESINYTIWYNSHNISNLDNFTLKEIFFLRKKDYYDIYIRKNKIQLTKEETNVMLIPKLGTNKIIIFQPKSRKFLEKTVECPSNNSFVFVYNGKFINLNYPINNRSLLIAGGTHSKAVALYNYSSNLCEEYPNLPMEIERHSMVYVEKNRVFIIGGDNKDNVYALNINSKLYQDFPKMNLKRKDASVCNVNDKYLYVFMGYVNEIGGITENYERLDISKNPFDAKWELLPINQNIDYMPRCYCGTIYNEGIFLFIGGLWGHNLMNSIYEMKYNEDGVMTVKNNEIKLKFKCAFMENNFVDLDGNKEVYYLFDFNYNIVKVDLKYKSIEVYRK